MDEERFPTPTSQEQVGVTMSFVWLCVILILSPFCFTLVFTPCVERVAIWRKYVDKPDNIRKLHGRDVPRIGGVALFAAYVGTVGLLFRLVGGQSHMAHVGLGMAECVVPSLAIVWVTGLVDDLRGLRAYHKLLAEAAAAALFVFNAHYLQILSTEHSVGSWVQLIVTAIWIVVCTNAFNLIDGVDGLAAGVALTIGVVDIAAALLLHSYGMVFAVIPIVGALLGFLPFNFSPASIFLGDSGSLAIGFILACCGVFWGRGISGGIAMMAPGIALTVPLIDTVVAVTRRFLRRQSIFSPDHGHLHHRLLSRGFTHRRVAVAMYLAAAFCGLLAIVDTLFAPPVAWAGVIILGCAVYFGIRKLEYPEFTVAERIMVEADFRRQLNAELRLSDIRDKLESADTPEKCWAAIRETYHQFGFDRVELKLQETFYSETRSQSSLGWITLRLNLEGVGFLNLHRRGGTHCAASNVRFADLMHEVLRKKAPLMYGAPFTLAVRTQREVSNVSEDTAEQLAVASAMATLGAKNDSSRLLPI